ncbi:hypothetical protein CTAYLR_006025 [Chrysophaeum taylorii]|uniref:Chloride channel protein n=1 Tax=Chrysophaeum taylorii TaxID=2483200 RepID=A0AAD7UKI1_9STRA|nr:hypothetical protein CTAYLR_006025 [Chrysophaeum taylorii]
MPWALNFALFWAVACGGGVPLADNPDVPASLRTRAQRNERLVEKEARRRLGHDGRGVKVGFWIIGRETDPTRAVRNRETWLRDEPRVSIVVAKESGVASDARVVAVPVPAPVPAAEIASGSMLNGTHVREQSTKRKYHVLNKFLRAKVLSMLVAICAAETEDFSVVMDEDTAINATNLRSWLATRRDSGPLYAGTQRFGGPAGNKSATSLPRLGGGPGIVFSNDAARLLCDARCSHDDVRLGGGDEMLKACADKAKVRATTSPLFSRLPAWSVRDPSWYISFHRMNPVPGSRNFDHDPRCRIVSRHVSDTGRMLDWPYQEHRCLPFFSIVGTPKSGTTSLFGHLVQNPEVRAPARKELRAFKPVVTPNKGFTMTASKVADLYPHVDPRDFVVAGDATPATLFHPVAPSLLVGEMRMRCVVLLRHPVSRSLSEFHNKRYAERWTGGAPSFDALVRATVLPLHREPAALLACQASKLTRCVPPVIWQSWYDLFLPAWFARDDGGGDDRVLLVFSEAFFADGQRVLDTVADFLSLRRFRIESDVVFNNHAARGVEPTDFQRGTNVLFKNATEPLCESEDVLDAAYGLMNDSIRALLPIVRERNYDLPEATAAAEAVRRIRSAMNGDKNENHHSGRMPYRDLRQEEAMNPSAMRRKRLVAWRNIPESLNFVDEENEVWRTKQAQLHYTNRGRWWTSVSSTVAKRWTLTFIVGMLTAVVGIFITYFTQFFTQKKFDTVLKVMKEEQRGKLQRGSSFFAWCGFNLLFASFATLMVWLEPVAAGSGISEVKCYLNGINIPRIVRFQTLACKALGVLFSVSAALPVGKEGPMIHSGSVIAAALAQGTRSIAAFGHDLRVLEFRTDPEKRDFVACGASAGVAAAFGAPIGGVLFALEEGASFWSTALTWRAFFCGMITIYTLYVVRNSENLWGTAASTKMFSFGEFTSFEDGKFNFSVWELLLFILLGCLGGLAGATFNGVNRRITIIRAKWVRSKGARALEALAVTFLCSVVMYVIPWIWPKCTQRPQVQVTWTQQEKDIVEELVQFHCPDGKYNEVASLFFTDSDTAIKQLFHFREVGNFNEDVDTFSSLAIATFYVPYTILACITYGIAVPSGLFVPSLLSGAALGRLVGHLLHRLDAQSGTFADSGTYALVGAAAGLGGMARMTISLTVILLEATGNVQNLLPLMLALMAARWVGNVFNHGLYDIHIRLKRLPYLEEEVPHIAAERAATAAQIMCQNPRVFPPLVRVGEIYDTLRACRHECFPVVSNLDERQLAGTVLRRTLCMIIHHRAYAPPGEEPSNRSDVKTRALSPLLSSAIFERAYPRYPKADELTVADIDRNCWLDLRPYADTAPFTVQDCASVQRTYKLFRTLGLRHLIVVDGANRVKGIITRKDLDEPTLEERLSWWDDTELESYQHEAHPSTMARFSV